MNGLFLVVPLAILQRDFGTFFYHLCFSLVLFYLSWHSFLFNIFHFFSQKGIFYICTLGNLI